jgi:hypothetical protein
MHRHIPILTLCAALPLGASEHLLGYVSGAEPLPADAWEIDLALTHRFDKGQGSYRAIDAVAGAEYGATDRCTLGFALKGQSVDTSGLIIGGYLPEEKSTGFGLTGVEGEVKYNVRSAAGEGLGVTLGYGVDFTWQDPHSGQDKNTLSFEYDVALQSYFLDGELVWMGNVGLETTIADRKEIPGLDPEIEWPTEPEVEVEFKAATGLSWRVAPRWFVGGEILYEAEHETEVGEERWTVFAGPSVHYARQELWATLTWLPQIRGGGETYDGQEDGYHLIEKTKQEVRVRLGFEF